MKTKEEVIVEYEADLLRMPEELRDEPFFASVDGEQLLTPRMIVEAMKDPNNADGQAFITAALLLSNEEKS